MQLETTVLNADNTDDGYALMHSEKVDIIFLDINFPGSTGFDLLASLKQEMFPIVMMSSSKRQEEMDKAFSFPQVMAYIEKPFSEKILREVLGNKGLI